MSKLTKKQRDKYHWHFDSPNILYLRKELAQIEWLYDHQKLDICQRLIDKVNYKTYGCVIDHDASVEFMRYERLLNCPDYVVAWNERGGNWRSWDGKDYLNEHYEIIEVPDDVKDVYYEHELMSFLYRYYRENVVCEEDEWQTFEMLDVIKGEDKIDVCQSSQTDKYYIFINKD